MACDGVFLGDAAAQAQIGFMHQRRCLKRDARFLRRESLRRQPSQLFVDNRQQLVRGLCVTARDGGTEVRVFDATPLREKE
jgi:hypothetical protein